MKRYIFWSVCVKQTVSSLSILLLLSVVCQQTQAQGDFGTVTPQTSDFMEYGETPVSLFNGRINLDIPIYTIKDRDFTIPISLTYTSDGFKPKKRSGFVGHDWILNAGGCITREVYGEADDLFIDEPNVGYGRLLGYWWAIEDPNYRFDPEDVWNHDGSLISYLLLGVDYRQDLFLFNFCGHKGQFMIDNNRELQSNIKSYKVNFSGFNKQYMSDIIPRESTITITTPDGYRYEFGGSRGALEFTLRYYPGTTVSNEIAHPTILAWHLKKITAPNGRAVKFNYVEIDMTQSNVNSFSPIWQSNKISKTSSLHSAQKTVILESLELDGTLVEFVRSTEQNADQFCNTGYSEFNGNCFQLDAIRVKQNNQLVYEYTFQYETRNKRRFLSSVELPDENKYLFYYNHSSAYPVPETMSEDLYGYWKNNDAQNSCGLINKVIYPTGGHTTFVYEKNFYGKRVETWTPENLIHPLYGEVEVFLTTESAETGGARIRKITHYSQPGHEASSKEYFYQPPGYPLLGNAIHYDTTIIVRPDFFDESCLCWRRVPDSIVISVDSSLSTLSSSGILYKYPPYVFSPNGSRTFIGDIWFQNYNIGEPHIGYSHVVELNSDSSMTAYTFTDYSKCPDYYDNNISAPFPADRLLAFNIDRSSSSAAKRGHLIKKDTYDADKLKIRSEEYFYDHINASHPKPSQDSIIYCDRGIITLFLTGNTSPTEVIISKGIKLQHLPLVRYQDSINGVVRKEIYQYNSEDLLHKKSLALHAGDSLKTFYKYPSDFAALGNTYDQMVNRNIVNIPVEEQTYRNNNLLQTTRYVHKLHNGSPVVDTLKVGYNNNPPEPRIVYHNYDQYGNPVYTTENNDIHKVFLWSYMGKYLVAEIQNASYNDLTTVMPNLLALNPNPSASDLSAVNALRSSLENALVTTYTYKPLVGVTSITDPRGVKSTYEYDPFNRLKCIKDHFGNTIKQFEYHYCSEE
ncbi:MAG TPA: RHS repeat protein [Paludibacter sp.]|nr:RHS repeat protein [Paludibacter sp.]